MNDTGMTLVRVILLVPACSAVLLALLPDDRVTARLNVLGTLLTFLASTGLFFVRPDPGSFLIVDDVNVVFIVLTTFVGFTTSVFSASYIAHELETGHLTPAYLRFYHAMYQTLMFAMNLALLANNVGLMWVAVELATLTTVLMVGIYRTPAALEAAWKYFLLGSVGIALALFGTILVYLAARSVVGEGLDAMAWNVLVANASAFDPALLNLAFVFLLLGYGTKVGLAPLHAWLPDAHAEGPTPISAVLSGLLLNVALFALLRFKMVMSANSGALAPGPLMVTLGLISVLFASFMLYRRHDIKRMFAYSSIEHMGIITFAFGMGGPLANFAGLAAHDLSQPHQVGDLLFRRAHRAGEGHADDVRDSGPDGVASGSGMEPRRRRDHHRGAAADGHLHDRVPDRHLDVCTTAVARDCLGRRVAGGAGGAAAATEWPRVRRAAWRRRSEPGFVPAHIRSSRPGRRRRHLSSGGPRRVVSKRRALAGIGNASDSHHADIARGPSGRPGGRGTSAVAACRGVRGKLGTCDQPASERTLHAARALGREGVRAHGAA